MTAEIAIMNKGAVALAADSAVTLGQSGKIFNTVNKLFTLSKHEPVGVMVYGGGELLDVPWENLVKMYRRQLKGRHFAKLEQYVTDFLEFLSNPTLFPAEQQKKFVIRTVANVMHRLREGFEDECQRHLSRGKLSVPKTDAILKKHVESYCSNIEAKARLPKAPADLDAGLRTNYSSSILETIDFIFPRLSPSSRERLQEAAFALFTRVRFPPDEITGVVIAGFGRDDLFPCLCQVTVHGVVNNWIRSMVHPAVQVGHEQPGMISAFAQQDVVSAFMTGLDGGVQRLLANQISKQWDELIQQIGETDALSSAAKRKTVALVGAVRSKDVFAEVQAAQHGTVINPILNAVAALPKDELAAMAESLVNLTVFRRKFSLDAETVGGPIDVAVISKWDGFIWIKRKHYFNKDLNPHFVAQYFCDE